MLSRKSLSAILFVLASALLLSACGGTSGPDRTPDPGQPLRGSIAGTVTTDLTSGTALRAAAAEPSELVALAGWQLDEDSLDFVPGELIVSFKREFRSQALNVLQVGDSTLRVLNSIPALSAQLYGTPTDRERTLELARHLNARPDVLYAHPNYIYHALRTPNDEHYHLQWHYPAIQLPAAWDTTTGSANTVVAVLDSGILHVQGNAGRSHPDFQGQVLPGYDFISDPGSAHDGDGRDPDPFDEFLPDGSNSFHGSHVAGTIAAATNNGSGVAGVDWNARILPVRVLGAGGSGTLLDIIDGLLWAAGRDVPGVPGNTNPADVINMSLGGEGSCPPALQQALDQASQNSIIVVAAGNSNVNVATFAPARCSSVITVGATDPDAQRASYSNYGSRIDLMAPGGEMLLGAERGILSVSADPVTRQFNYVYQQGTSMAAPHVAGVISLLKALQPELGWQEALAVLTATARPLSAAACNNLGSGDGRTLSGSDCGAGLIDASLAVQSVRDGVIPPPATGGTALQFTPGLLDLGSSTEIVSFQLTNTSSDSVNWKLEEYAFASDNPGDELDEGALYIPYGSSSFGTLAPGASETTRIGVDRTKALPDSNYQLALVFELEGAEAQLLELRFRTLPARESGPTGPMIVAAFVQDSSGELQPSGSIERAGVVTEFRFDALPGDNIVAAWSDENANNIVDAGDYFGTHPFTVNVTAGSETRGVQVPLAKMIDGFGVPDAPARLVELLQPAAGD